MHLRGLPRRRRLVPHRHRLLRHVRDRHRDARALAARGRLDRGLAGLRAGGDHARAHHVRDARVRARPCDLAVRRVVGLDRRGQLRARPGLQRELAVPHAITRDRHRLDRTETSAYLTEKVKDVSFVAASSFALRPAVCQLF